MEDVMGELENIFNDVKDKESVYEDVPDGEYLAEIINAEYRESKNTGRPMVMITSKIIHGQEEGNTHAKFLMLTGNDKQRTRQNLNEFANTLKDLGLKVDGGFQATLDKLDQLEGTEVAMKIETTDGWTNTHLTLAE